MTIQYHRPNPDAVDAALASEYQGDNHWYPPKGYSQIRVLPPWDPSGRICVRIGYHYGVPGTKKPLACPLITLGQPCPIHEVIADASESPMRARVKHMFNIVDRSNQKTLEAITALLPNTAKEGILGLYKHPQWGPDCFDPMRGFDVYITREGEQLGTTYRVDGAREASSVGASEQDVQAVLNAMKNLDEVVQSECLPYEKLFEVAFGRNTQAQVPANAPQAQPPSLVAPPSSPPQVAAPPSAPVPQEVSPPRAPAPAAPPPAPQAKPVPAPQSPSAPAAAVPAPTLPLSPTGPAIPQGADKPLTPEERMAAVREKLNQKKKQG